MHLDRLFCMSHHGAVISETNDIISQLSVTYLKMAVNPPELPGSGVKRPVFSIYAPGFRLNAVTRK